MPLEMTALFFLAGLAFTGLFVVAIRRAIRFQRAVKARMDAIRAAENPIVLLDYSNQYVYVSSLKGEKPRWQPGFVAVTAGGIVIYDRSVAMEERLRVSAEDVRWFGRPEKYGSGQNEIWLHLERGGEWSIFKLKLWRDDMQTFVRALKTIVPPELVTAYRRRRPYIHAGPETAQPAAQDIHGAWTLDEPVDLYLMPRFLVIQRAGKVLRKLALEGVQQIGALHRLDAPGSQGLVRFRAEEETFAFAHPRHEPFAALLAEAAKRTLEAPPERKQKNKLEEDYDYDYDPEEDEFILEENYDA